MIAPVLAWLFTALLLVLLVACIAAGRGVLRRNHLFGIRIPALLRSDEAWRAGHAGGVVPAGVAFAVALVCSVIGLAVSGVYWGSIVAFVGGFVWAVVAATRAAEAATSGTGSRRG